MKRYLALYSILLTCISIPAFCQFTYKSNVGEIKQSGFHKILITPELAAKSNADLSDIRIADRTGEQLPYILNRDQPLFEEKELREFPIVSINKNKDSNTQIILQAVLDGIPVAEQENYSFVLVMKKADAYRIASVSGGDEKDNWYSISDRIILNAGSNQPGKEYAQVISLPPSNYRYLKIVMFDKGLQPLNVVKAGLLLNKNVYGKYINIPAPRIVQKDSSNHKSYIGIHFNDFYPVSRLQFSVKGPALYKRNFAVYDTAGSQNTMKANGIAIPGMDSVMLSGEKVKDLVMVIDNNDDQPVQLDGVLGLQLQHFIVANLQQGSEYHILTGNKTVAPPLYDLRYFADSIKLIADQAIVPGNPVHYQDPSQPLVKQPDQSKVPVAVVWVVIAVVLAFLIWLSFRLIKDLSNKPQS